LASAFTGIGARRPTKIARRGHLPAQRILSYARALLGMGAISGGAFTTVFRGVSSPFIAIAPFCGVSSFGINQAAAGVAYLPFDNAL
jgi:hypothetical protein